MTKTKVAIVLQAGDEINLYGERQTVVRIEKPFHGTVLVHTNLTETNGSEPYAVEALRKVEVL